MIVLTQRFIIALLLGTIGLMTWYELGMEQHLVIDHETDLTVVVNDDREVRGRSIGRLFRDDDALVMTCQIRRGFDWPFCQISVTLAFPPYGVDLSRYDTVRLDLDVTGPGEPNVRLHLRNFEPAYSTIHNYVSLRVNEIEYRPNLTSGPVEVSLSQFEVPPWWRTEFKTPFADSRQRIDNVSRLEILTDSLAQDGEHVVTIRSIEFSGKWFSRDLLYFGILLVWMLVTVGFLIVWLNATRQSAYVARQRQQELEVANLSLQQRSEELREQAHRDPLTGAHNRAGLRELLQKHLHLVRSSQCKLSIIMLDIDHFKPINDVHGHATGDVILQLFARRIEENTRANDQLVRWGGEEFLLLCTDTCAAEAVVLAEKLRVMLASSTWPHGGALTCSMGLGQLGNESISELLERIDHALYRAKANGRNRVEVADDAAGSKTLVLD